MDAQTLMKHPASHAKELPARVGYGANFVLELESSLALSLNSTRDGGWDFDKVSVANGVFHFSLNWLPKGRHHFGKIDSSSRGDFQSLQIKDTSGRLRCLGARKFGRTPCKILATKDFIVGSLDLTVARAAVTRTRKPKAAVASAKAAADPDVFRSKSLGDLVKELNRRRRENNDLTFTLTEENTLRVEIIAVYE